MFRRKAHQRARLVRAWRFASGGLALGLAVAGHAYASDSAVVSTQTSAHAPTLQQAHNWLQQGQAKTAYSMLAPLEPELAGDVGFDLLFGQAALQSDRPSEAAFAFERCLAIDSSNGLCRLGM